LADLGVSKPSVSVERRKGAFRFFLLYGEVGASTAL
jgi:hypothetical protein